MIHPAGMGTSYEYNELEIKGVDYTATLTANRLVALMSKRLQGAMPQSIISGLQGADLLAAGFTVPHERRDIRERIYFLDADLAALDNGIEVRVERKSDGTIQQTIKLPTRNHQEDACLDRNEYKRRVPSLRPDFRNVSHEVVEKLLDVFGAAALHKGNGWKPALHLVAQRTKIAYHVPEAPQVKLELAIDAPMVPRLFFGQLAPITVVEFEVKDAPRKMTRGQLRGLLHREAEWLRAQHPDLQIVAKSNVQYLAEHIRAHIATPEGARAYADLRPEDDWYMRRLPKLGVAV